MHNSCMGLINPVKRINNRMNTSPNLSATTALSVASTLPSSRGGMMLAIRRFAKEVRLLHQREKRRIREEILQVPGLMALLMKPRNGQKWTKEEYQELRAQLRRLSRLSIYLASAALPGTTLTLPLIAWWLDQRQQKRLNNPPNNTR